MTLAWIAKRLHMEPKRTCHICFTGMAKTKVSDKKDLFGARGLTIGPNERSTLSLASYGSWRLRFFQILRGFPKRVQEHGISK
jgi:hypothetical protein